MFIKQATELHSYEKEVFEVFESEVKICSGLHLLQTFLRRRHRRRRRRRRRRLRLYRKVQKDFYFFPFTHQSEKMLNINNVLLSEEK